ncbi:F-box/LRR-repeat protein [Camellia lanceoleosa]|uniref:F-box/LRR-repeat protein n=1 Tax=Camellia lanceoleosa TaxID=1840588 RepID=A0ACC0H4M6_9ERIC|nr:F-box/LRR-repeat protein [Camellia lanceoleosa]
MDIVTKPRSPWGWGDMDHNILTKIFRNTCIEHLSSSVSWVCRSWRFACWEVMFWNQNFFDLQQFEVFSDKLGPPSSPADVDEYWKTEIRAMKLIQSIFQGNEAYGTPAKGWSQSLRQLLLPSSFHVSDRILLYIAERTLGLTMISLSNTSKITGTSFTMAITHWTHLKLLIIGPINGGFNIDIIRQLGKHCNKLESLHIHVNSFTLDKDSATAIATNLPRLKSLSFLRCSIRKSGVKVVAKQCPKVSFVAIECCSLVEEIEPSLTRTRAPRCRDFEEWRSRKLEFRVTNDRRW